MNESVTQSYTLQWVGHTDSESESVIHSRIHSSLTHVTQCQSESTTTGVLVLLSESTGTNSPYCVVLILIVITIHGNA